MRRRIGHRAERTPTLRAASAALLILPLQAALALVIAGALVAVGVTVTAEVATLISLPLAAAGVWIATREFLRVSPR